MVCHNCGKELPDATTCCEHCGTKLQNDPSDTPKPSDTEQNSMSPLPLQIAPEEPESACKAN